MRGFVQEILALCAWIFAFVAIHFLHTPLTEKLIPFTGNNLGAPAVLAFAVLLIVPLMMVRVMARQMGRLSRNSLLGPIDRVIGFGFGTIKGLLIVVLAFSILVLGYDTVWGIGGRPDWISQSRSYPFVDASSRALVKMIADRRNIAAEAEEQRLRPK